jgi:hemerythrin superfamily protein
MLRISHSTNQEYAMATASRSSASPSKRPANSTRSSQQDAVALLKSDHRQVAEWFEQFEKSRSDDRKTDLAQRICAALRVHMTLEEEIFYPAFLEATGEEDLHHEAEIEHAGAKHLISQIESSGPDDDHFDAKVKVLSEMIKHHVKEEEQRGGMFAKARASGMDLKALGARMMERKSVLEGGGKERSN